jgi:hypothetical protein
VTCVQKTRRTDDLGMNEPCPRGTVSRSDAVVHENEPDASSGKTQSPGDGGFRRAREESTHDR